LWPWILTDSEVCPLLRGQRYVWFESMIKRRSHLLRDGRVAFVVYCVRRKACRRLLLAVMLDERLGTEYNTDTVSFLIR
jgi:hypothetical protein